MIALATHDDLMPRSPGGTLPGAAMSLLAHVALVAALAYGVGWHSPAPQLVSAELWAAVPQSAAAAAAAEAIRAPEPAPPPAAPTMATVAPEAQIAIEKARQDRREQARADAQDKARQERQAREQADADRQRQAAARELAAQREQAAQDARLAKQREDNLRRMMGQIEGAAPATGTSASRGTAGSDAAPSAGYGGRLIRAIKPNIVFTDNHTGNPAAVVEVRSAPDGTVIGRSLVKPSGNAAWDDAVLRAIDRTAVLPRDTDGRMPATLTITFRPRD